MSQTYTTCPECSGTRTKSNDKCLSTNTDTGVYLCHHCGYSGIAQGQKPTNTERKPKTGGVATKSPAKVTAASFKLSDKTLPDTVAEFFSNRGISKNVLERNKIGFNGKEIVFPYIKAGKIVNIKYRSLDKKFRQEAGAEKVFYGLDDIKGQDIAIIVEGEFDKLAFEVTGYLNVISVPDGAPAPNAKLFASKFDYIANCEEELKHVKKFYLAVDNDEPGQKLQEELARRLSPEKCWIMTYPKGCKDINDVLVKHGETAIMECYV
ncbi:MAG: toprim domain-containing protein, partial [Candidatus Anammoxibacter sp.]